jgi:hypothetical protein
MDHGRQELGDEWYPLADRRLLTTVMTVAKLHVVAVHPDQQRVGHGARLVNGAVGLAPCDGIVVLFGQFGPPWAASAKVLLVLRFSGAEAGEPLGIEMATGAPGLIAGRATETCDGVPSLMRCR